MREDTTFCQLLCISPCQKLEWHIKCINLMSCKLKVKFITGITKPSLKIHSLLFKVDRLDLLDPFDNLLQLGRRAILAHRTHITFGTSWQAHNLPIAHHDGIDLFPLVLGQPRLEVQSRFLWRLCFDPAQSIADSMDMHIDTDTQILVPSNLQRQVAHLGPHTRQRRQSFNGVWYIAAVLIPQNLCGALQIGRFFCVESNGGNHLVERCFINVQNVLQTESSGQFLLQLAHSDTGHGVLGLRGQHQSHQCLKSLHDGRSCCIRQSLAAHGVHRRLFLFSQSLKQIIHNAPVGRRLFGVGSTMQQGRIWL